MEEADRRQGDERAAVPLLRCGHGIPPLRLGDRAVCPSCRSFFDLAAVRREFLYDGSYPGARGHHDPGVGKLKVRTLSRYLEVTGIRLEGQNVCEVGFGGGHCLAFMAGRARNAAGIESVAENLDHAMGLGVPGTFLYRSDSLPPVLPIAIDLWVFLDSFEHLDDPAGFLAWLTTSSGKSATVLLVAPDGGSLSARLMGRYWPHRLPDHPFHWTRKGLAELFDRHGFGLARSFHPWKYVSVGMIVSHARLKMFPGGARRSAENGNAPGRLTFRVNAGEMGLVFRKRCA